jgi:hypothetical protein
MMRRSILIISIFLVLLTTFCVKETYHMDKLSMKVHLSPSMAISVLKGDVSFSDMVKPSDTVVFDNNKYVKVVFKKDSLINLTMADFIAAKGALGLMNATIKPETLDLEIEDFLTHLTGEILISNPIIKLVYSNSFKTPVQLTLNATGKRKTKTQNLNLLPFTLNYPVAPVTDVKATYTIDKSNSSLVKIISMPPEKIFFSGNAAMSTTVKNIQESDNLLDNGRLIGSLEVEVPLEFQMNSLQFTDTLDNSLADAFEKDSDISWDDFESFRIVIDAKNGFPMEVSLNMSLLDSVTHLGISSIDASKVLLPAPTNTEGIATGSATSTTEILLTRDFFNAIKRSDKILFQFTLNTTDKTTKSVKIYSDYRIDFKAAFVMKTNLKFNLE